MNKLSVAVAIILLAPCAYAQSRGLKDIDRELKQTKNTAAIRALIESISVTIPQTDADVAILGQLMDKYPVQGQKALAGIKDPQLVTGIMKECDRQAQRLKTIRLKRIDDLIDMDRQVFLNSYMNTAAIMDVLSKLNNKDAIPLLRGYLQDEDLSRFASLALGRLGDSGSLDGILGGMGYGKTVDLSGYGDAGLVRVVQELDKVGADAKRKDALINQIKGSPSPERKRILKDLALNHRDPMVRDRSGLALLNSMMARPEPGDNAFISEWVGRAKNDETGYWAVTSLRVSYENSPKTLDKNAIALLVDVLRTSTYSPTRSEAAQSLGMFKVKETLPYLEECSGKDKDSSVRGYCMVSYWKISGKIPEIFHVEDIEDIRRNIHDPVIEKKLSTRRKNDPERLFREALRTAFEEYERSYKE